MKAKDTHHVMKNPSGGWTVKKSGTSRASGNYASKSAAVSKARSISKNQGTRVVVHRKDGRIAK